jgi:hypothetical protein
MTGKEFKWMYPIASIQFSLGAIVLVVVLIVTTIDKIFT